MKKMAQIPETVSRMIKRCNDFGAGGVSVAIGELADGLDINLDLVPKKYEGLDGTELAISDSRNNACFSPASLHWKETASRQEYSGIHVWGHNGYTR